MPPSRTRLEVLGIGVDRGEWTPVLDLIENWAEARASRYVCLTNAHSIVTANRWPDFGEVLHGADLSLPDGAPVAWMLRRLGAPTQVRINGPDLMWRLCERAAAKGLSVYLYGSSDNTLSELRARLSAAMPNLKIVDAHAPPFRPLTAEEDREVIARINGSGAHVVFVGLGCPKQEMWMATHRHAVHAVMIGVGAAFDYHAGRIKRAPVWLQRIGLEWLHRLSTEPRRLWKRYLITNTFFVVGAARQLCRRHTS